MNKRGQKVVIFLLLLSGFTLGYLLWPREPQFGGRKLSAWLQDLAELDEQRPPQNQQELWRAWELRRQSPVAAVQSIGPKALPWLLRWVRSAPNPASSAHKLNQWVSGTLHVALPEKVDRCDLAIAGFDALGTSAAPAVPELTRMLLRPRDHYRSMGCLSCLYAIGQPALPALARALTNADGGLQKETIQILQAQAPHLGPALIPVLLNVTTNSACLVHTEALSVLGEIGPDAKEISPWLESAARDSANVLSGPAMRVLAQVSEQPEQYLGLWRERLSDTNFAGHAAFALARSGFPGIPPLLEALTNKSHLIKNAAITALSPPFRNCPPGAGRRDVSLGFANLGLLFDRRLAWRNSSKVLSTAVEAQSLSLCLGQLLNHPDPGTRRHLVQLLASLGRFGAPGLCRAAVDSDETVRTAAKTALAGLDVEVAEGAIVRGPKDKKRIALVFTGHQFAEGRYVIAEELARHNAQASFFLTGDFLANEEFRSFIDRIYRDGHYVGPHSDKHLLYCPWEGPRKSLLSREEFESDFTANLGALNYLGEQGPYPRYFVPPYEHYCLDIVDWAVDLQYVTINYTPGTRSPADYTGEGNPNFVSSKDIFDSIVAREQRDPCGLNGFILLFHTGSGPEREDKFHDRFGDLLNYLGSKGYEFVAIDELFDPEAAQVRRKAIAPRAPTDRELREMLRKRYGLAPGR